MNIKNTFPQEEPLKERKNNTKYIYLYFKIHWITYYFM
jgi:hypothetical protein